MSRSNGSRHCADEAAFSPSSCNLPSVSSSSGLGTEEDEDNEVDMPLGFNYQHWPSPAAEAVFVTMDTTQWSDSEEYEEERKKQSCTRHQHIGATGFAAGFDVSYM